MVYSMTGFGQAQAEKEGERFVITLKSVNHRYFETSFHLAPEMEHLESFLRSYIHKKIKRGRVNISINHINHSPEAVVLNEALVKKYHKSLKALCQDIKLAGPISLNSLLSLPGVLRCTKHELSPKEREVLIKLALGKALNNLYQMRRKEGQALFRDLKMRVERISAHMATIKKAVRQLAGARKKKKSPEEWEGFLRNHDVAEEITRINFHLNSFSKHLRLQDPKGKILDFIAQELQREINTLGAKAQDKHITYQVVMVKDQVEKIREQVQNVE